MKVFPEKEAEIEYRTYAKRWLVLLSVVLLNMSGAMVSNL